MSIGFEQVHRYTLEEYHRLIESGGFNEDTRVELIDGWIVDKSPQDPRHDLAVRWLSRRIVRALDPARFDTGVATALTIGRSEPEPGLAVSRARFTNRRGPRHARRDRAAAARAA